MAEMVKSTRQGTVSRKTGETDIHLDLVLDGKG